MFFWRGFINMKHTWVLFGVLSFFVLFFFLTLIALSCFTLWNTYVCFISHWGRNGISACGDISLPIADSAEVLFYSWDVLRYLFRTENRTGQSGKHASCEVYEYGHKIVLIMMLLCCFRASFCKAFHNAINFTQIKREGTRDVTGGCTRSWGLGNIAVLELVGVMHCSGLHTVLMSECD